MEAIFNMLLLLFTLLYILINLDHCHLIVEFKPNIQLSKLVANLKTVSSRLIRKEYPEITRQYFYGKPFFWTGAYFVASCGGVTVEQLKAYVENQTSPKS